jgi:hypothetical protein
MKNGTRLFARSAVLLMAFGDDYSCAWHAANGSWAYLTTWYWGPTLLD